MKLLKVEESSIINDLKNKEFAASYLEELLFNSTIPAFLQALRLVISAQSSMQKVALKTKLGRESLYKTISRKGNPQLKTIEVVLKELGYRFAIKEIHKLR